MKVQNGIPTYTAKLKLYCKTEEISADPNSDKLAFYDTASTECLKSLAEKTKDTLGKIYTTAKEYDCDVYQLKNLLFRYAAKNYPSFKDNVLSIASVTFEVKCVNKT